MSKKNRHWNAPNPGEFQGTGDDLREYRKWRTAMDHWEQSDEYERLEEIRFNALSPAEQAEELMEDAAWLKALQGCVADAKEAQARRTLLDEQRAAQSKTLSRLDKLRNMERSARAIGSIHEANAFAEKIKELA